jgi:hypothetical protein
MSPGILTVAAFTSSGTVSFEISATPAPVYNDEIRSTTTITLQPGFQFDIQRWLTAQPNFGQRFTILKAFYNNNPSPQYINNFPQNNFTLQNSDPNGRYLLVTPADTGAPADGFPHTSDEYAVYFVRGAADYVFPGVSSTVTQWVQTNTLVAPGGALANTGSSIYTGQYQINPLAASLMVMNDTDLYQALLALTAQEAAAQLEANTKASCVGPPYNATNFTTANNVEFQQLINYAKTQPQYPWATGSNAQQIYRSQQNISYFNGINQKTQAIRATGTNQPYPQFKTQTERLMYIQGMTLTAARNQITGQNPSGPAGVPCSTIYQIINS